MTRSFRGLKRVFALILCAVMLFGLMPAVLAGNVVPEADAKQVSIDSAAEGAILLENDGVLPLDKDTTVAVFGRTQYDLIQGGSGSGWVNTNISYNFIDGMDEAGIKYDETLGNIYKEWCADEENYLDHAGLRGQTCNPEMPLTSEVVNDAADNADVAIVIIGRNASEGEDRTTTAGDWYLQPEEEDMLAKVNAAFDNVVILLNISGLIDLTWTEDYDSITAILNVWMPGSYGALAVGDILAGNVTPSGKLASTWAYDYSDYPTSKDEIGATFGKGVQDPVYAEDIYVGYRYFETFAPDAVMYEFGYGLSYTTFSQEVVGFSADKDEVTVEVKVTNTGDTYSGKEVVQVYYSAPQGKLGKPAYELAAFAKTDLLAPGESQIVTVTYNTNDMASYDDGGVTGKRSAYVLEEGDYVISAGSSVRNLSKAGTYTVNELQVTEQLSEALAPQESISILTTGDYDKDTGIYAAKMVSSAERTVDVKTKYDTDLPWVELYGEDAGVKLADVANGTKTTDDFLSQLTFSQLVQLFGGTTSNMPEKATGAAGGYGQTLGDYGVELVTMADGPAGVRLDMDEDDTGNTAFPVAIMLASTWNLELLEKMGEAVGEEAALNDVDVWLAPAMNIHRDPLCGRNYEYYSEDPVITGMMAAATTRGVQSNGVGVALKHFAVNNQESFRGGGNSILSERAAREIYLKGFEIAVKTANPWWIMSSYNQINGSQAASNYELITQITRDEWGFTGSFMTDWGGAKDNGNASMLRSGHDLSMQALVGFTQRRMPTGFEASGGYFDPIVCTYCGEEHGQFVYFLMGWLNLTPWEKCNTEGCSRPLEDPPEAGSDGEWSDDYYEDSGNIYLKVEGGNDRFICTLAEFEADTSGIITGLVYGNITMGEIQRCAANLTNSLAQALRFRKLNGMDAYEYAYGDDWYAVAKSEIKLGTDRTAFIEGDGDGKFRPEDSITRAEVAAIVARTLGGYDANASYTTTFKDVDAKKWYAPYIGCIEDLKLINGYGDGTFRPEEAITREELAAILARTTEVMTADDDMTFNDNDKISKWALNYIYTCFKNGWMEGDTAGTIRPTDKITRAETTAMINRILGGGMTNANSLANIDVESLKTFTDVAKDKWYYYHIIEAANDFTYYINNDGDMIWIA